MDIRVVIRNIYIKISIDVLWQKQDEQYAQMINDSASVGSSLIMV